MIKDLDNSIVEEVKAALGYFGECEDSELLEKLRKARIFVHPDKFKEQSSKDDAEKKFKALSNLIDKFNIYLEHKRITLPSTEIKDTEIKAIERENELTSLQDEIADLKKDNHSLSIDKKILEMEIKSTKNQIDELNNQRIADTYEELLKIYKLKKTDNIFGISAIVLYIATELKSVQNLLTMLMTEQQIATIFLQIIAIVIFLLYIYKILSSLSIERITMSFINDTRFLSHLIKKANITSSYSKKIDEYILESDIINQIKWTVNKKWNKFFFWWHKEKVIASLTQYVIAEYLKKKLFSKSYSVGLDKAFILSPSIQTYIDDDITQADDSELPF